MRSEIAHSVAIATEASSAQRVTRVRELLLPEENDMSKIHTVLAGLVMTIAAASPSFAQQQQADACAADAVKMMEAARTMPKVHKGDQAQASLYASEAKKAAIEGNVKRCEHWLGLADSYVNP
jgi:hypothetical protein